MGLLDLFNTYEGQQGLGLLAAASARSDGAGFGQRLQEGLGMADNWKRKKAQDEFQQMQIEAYKAKALQEKQAMEAAMAKRAALPTLFSQGSAGAPEFSMDSVLPSGMQTGMKPQAAVPARQAGIDLQAALRAGYSPKEIQELDALRNIGMNKVARTVTGLQNGREVLQQMDDYGRPVGQGMEQYKAPIMVDRAGQIDAVSPYMQPGQSFAKTMTFADKNAAGNLNIARERLTMDKTKAAAETANGGYSSKPLPATALKMQSEAVDAINTASGINQQLANVENQISTGKLSFGPISNALNAARNTMGVSSEESRNLSSFHSTMERLRNDSLRLNAGVQTDGDAQRAWNELFQNINDTNIVKQRLKEITALNQRAEELQKLKVDQIRGNYNAPPMDFTKSKGAPSATGSSSGWGIERVN